MNAGVTNQPDGTGAEASTDEFVRVMVTNALGPLRVIGALQNHVEPTGAIGVMSSGQGSVANTKHAAVAPADAILLRPPCAVSALQPEELHQLARLFHRLLDLDKTKGP